MKFAISESGASSAMLERCSATVLLCYPALMIAVKGGMNAAFLIALLLALGAWLLRYDGLVTPAWDRRSSIYLAAMAALPVAILLSLLAHHQFSARAFDAASRFLLAVPLFLLFRRMPFNVVAVVQYAFPLGAIAGLLVGSLELSESYRRMRTGFLDAIHFGDFELILAFLSLLSIDWVRRDSHFVRALKFAGFLAGLYASYASMTRGGWIAIPVLLVAVYYFKAIPLSARIVRALLVALFLVLVIVYNVSEQMRYAVNEPIRNLRDYGSGNLDTDNGVRLQLYKAAGRIFVQNPAFGVGPDGFGNEVTKMELSGQLTPVAAAVGRGEVHNEILSRAVSLGVLGLIAILAIYFVPLWIFLRCACSGSGETKRAGVMGVVFVIGFLIFGLTVDILNLTMAAAFYSFTVAILLAASLHVHNELSPTPNCKDK